MKKPKEKKKEEVKPLTEKEIIEILKSYEEKAVSLELREIDGKKILFKHGDENPIMEISFSCLVSLFKLSEQEWDITIKKDKNGNDLIFAGMVQLTNFLDRAKFKFKKSPIALTP